MECLIDPPWIWSCTQHVTISTVEASLFGVFTALGGWARDALCWTLELAGWHVDWCD